jgi:hypothetical protein
MRAFFSGEMRGYTVSRITYPTPKLPRLEIINTLRESLGNRMIFVQEQSAFDNLLAADYVDKCVILDTSTVRVRDGEWLRVLSKAEFFIAPPGIVMPMCHNSVEALAVGSVPITNYPEWFDPSLEHMRNCIAFDSREDLLAKVERALAMDAATIASLKAGAIAYYDAHLSNQSFLSRLEARRERRIDLLMLMEEYVRKNAHQLNARSVLVRGKPNATRRSWLPTLGRS